MTGLRSRLAEGVLGPGRTHAEWRPYRHRLDGQARGVVVGLSHGAEVAGYFRPPYDREVRAIAEAGMVVVVPGSSPQGWGNDGAVDDVDRAVSHLRGELGCARPVGLLGFSMGALAVCRWARDHGDEVAALALVTPAVDLRHLLGQPAFGAEIEAAHGGAAALWARLDDLDPTAFAADLRRIPTAIWHSADDPVIPPSVVAAFAERHGGGPAVRNLGHRGHDPAAAPVGELADFLGAGRAPADQATAAPALTSSDRSSPTPSVEPSRG